MSRTYKLTGTAAASPGKKPRHVINPAQKSLYWRKWSACRRVLLAAGHSPAEADASRRELTEKALGSHKSHTHFSNRDLDKVLAAFAAVSTPSDLAPQLDAETAPRRRLVRGIQDLIKAHPGLESYIREILVDASHTGEWTRLSTEDLTKLRATLARRVGEKSKRARAESAALRDVRRLVACPPDGDLLTALASCTLDGQPLL